jgi:hypothetical protein
MKRKRQLAIRNQRGVALAYVGILFLAIAGMAAVAIDTAHLALTANEVQVAADAAATSGALRMVSRPAAQFANPDGSANMGAHDTLRENFIDGHNADNASLAIHATFERNPLCLSGPVIVSPQFARINAVSATVTVTVPNLLASLVGGSATSTISRSARAIVRGSEVLPTLPVAVGDCSSFQDFCFTAACLPSAINIQSLRAAWTAFGDPASSPSDIIAYLNMGGDGSAREPEGTEFGETINLNNEFPLPDQLEITNAIQTLVNRGYIELERTEFTIPVVHCLGSKVNEESDIVGFAKVVIKEVLPAGGIVVSPVLDPTQAGPPTPCFFGAGFVELVE